MNNDKKVIMIVEDDAFVMDIYKTKLSNEGFKLLIANNGKQAIEKIEEGVVIPDLILLDIVMPYVDGLTVLKKIQKNKIWKSIPVILLTNLSQREEIKEGFRLGAKDYLIKSHFTPSEVVEKVNQYLIKN